MTISGDFNLDLLRTDKIKVAEDFVNLMFSNFYQPVILQPTRYSDHHKPALIDNIFVNSLDIDGVSGNLIAKVTDHMPNFVLMHKEISKNHKSKILKRDYKNFDESSFINDVSKTDFDPDGLLGLSSLDSRYEHFQGKILDAIQNHAPLKPLTKKQHKQRKKPWITNGILKSISIKNKFYKKFLKSKDPYWYQQYKFYRDTLNHLIRRSKRNHYKSYFETFKNNSKKIWKGINELLNKSNKTASSEIIIKNNGVLVNDQKQVANRFNEYFTSIAQNLVDKLRNPKKQYSDYLKDPVSNSFMISPVLTAEVLDQLQNLDETKAADSYDIPVNLIKLVQNHIAKPLTTLINLSFSTGYYPKALKYAKVIPIFKAKAKNEVSNYRPISLLPLFNKIFEKLMYSRLIGFLNKNKVLYTHQFGFQKNKSTSLAILDVCIKLVESIEKREFSCCIFLDFAKAFDTVNHNILINKLEHYGIRGIPLDWFRSYLNERSQRVFVGGELSVDRKIKHGVPQGSVLGPLLFLLYINDIPKASKMMNFYLFADDTSLFYSHKNINTLEEVVNVELGCIQDWLVANKLTLNTNKSNFMIIKPRQKKVPKKIQLSINGDHLNESDCVKYLGVLIDDKLTWKQHIQHVNTKVAKSIGILAKMRHFAPNNILLNIYNAFISPHINYGIINWGGAYQNSLDPLSKNQKKAARLLFFKQRNERSNPLFKALNSLNLHDTYKLECAKFMYDISKGNCEKFFNDIFQLIREKHHLQTRQATSGNFALPVARTNYKRRLITNFGVEIWNNTPKDIRTSPTKKIFGKRYKQLLLQNY